ncbi:hypothetical protein NECAME_07054 [Necator americanus]|uniref:Uncharacterized protein n=1 Tax=Necator americanus TaxID=51031 RepID=W2TSK9_NECAM|nr:hypothetical protein NECAME_07054 [Necator americanus]ETN84106.1 hypothetical protein NECAME_07054 [Necator americanus]
MKEARLRWFGHVLRREKNSVAKTALKVDVSRVRRRRRPRICWLCTADAMDRTKWNTKAERRTPQQREGINGSKTFCTVSNSMIHLRDASGDPLTD